MRPPPPAWGDFGGDAARGKLTIGRSGCGSCHEIPGIANARGLTGPPLTHFARRTIVAGLLPNTPQNLVHWVRQPQAVVPNNAMPDSGLTDAQARDVAAYLYTLR
jgi:cytochrome c1